MITCFLLARRIALECALVSCLSVVTAAPAARAAESIGEFLEPSTVCVVRIDLQRFDLPACLKVIQEELPNALPTQTVGGVPAAVGAALESLKGAGANQLYVTLSAIELTNGKIALVVPSGDPKMMAEQLQNLIGILPPALGYSVHQRPGGVIACTDAQWSRLQAQGVLDTNHLPQALADQSDLHLSFNVGVRDSLRREVAQLWPEQLPSFLPIPLSPKQLMSDVRTVQIGLTSPPALRVELAARCIDSLAAERTAASLRALLDMRDIGLPIAAMAEDRVVLSLDRQQLSELVRRFMPDVSNRTATMQQSNHLKQLILAVHNFHAAHNGVPPRMTVSPTGEPLLSWRVHLLPYIGQTALYRQFQLDQPWSSPHNRRLVEQMPAVYQLLTQPGLEPGMTCIQAPRMAGSFWNGEVNRLVSFREITDGMSNTLCFASVPRDRAVIWTQPEDMSIDPERIKEDLFGDRDQTQVAFFDGSVQTIGNTFPAEIYRAWLTGGGGEKVERP